MAVTPGEQPGGEKRKARRDRHRGAWPGAGGAGRGNCPAADSARQRHCATCLWCRVAAARFPR
jgi:hypothetical protein